MLKRKRVEEVLFFLTILFLPTQLGRHFWPEFSFVYSLPVDYISPTVYFWDLVVVALGTVWVLGKPKVNKLALNLFLFFMFTQAVSLVGANNLGAGLVRLEQYMVAGLFGVYIANSKFQIPNSKLFWPLLLGVLFESVLAMGQFIKGGTLGFWILGERTFTISTPAIAKFDFYGSEFLRPYGTFSHPNVLAGFLLISLLLTQVRIKVINIIIVIAITLTVSRATIMAGIFSALMLLNKKWKMLFVLALTLLLPVFYIRFSTIFNFDNLSLIRREALSIVAIDLWRSYPVFGVGLNNFIPVAADQLLAGPSRFLQPVHNIFLLSLSETGILGLLGLFWLIGFPIFRIIQFQMSNFKFPMLLIWSVIIFLGLFDHYFLTLPQGYRLLFLVWGISLSFINKEYHAS